MYLPTYLVSGVSRVTLSTEEARKTILLGQFQIEKGFFDIYVSGVARDSAAGQVREPSSARARLDCCVHCGWLAHIILSLLTYDKQGTLGGCCRASVTVASGRSLVRAAESRVTRDRRMFYVRLENAGFLHRARIFCRPVPNLPSL